MASPTTIIKRFLLVSLGIVLGVAGSVTLIIGRLTASDLSARINWLLLAASFCGMGILCGWGWLCLRQLAATSADKNEHSDPPSSDSSEYHFRRLLESVDLVPWEADIQTWKFLYVGPQAKELLGFPVSDWYEKEFWESRIHIEDRDEVICRRRHACSTRKPIKLEYRMIRRDGSVAWVHDLISIPKSKSGSLVFRGCLVDITGRKDLEVKLRQSEKMQAITRVASSAAHDFNNILTAIYGYAQILMSRTLTSEMRKDVTEILKSVDRAKILTRQLRVNEVKEPCSLQLVNLDQLLHGMGRMLRTMVHQRVELNLQRAQLENQILVNPGELERAIMNLVVNANDAMPSGGTLLISTADVEFDKSSASDSVSPPPGRYVQLTVRDTGAGMTEEVRQQIFEPFFTTKGKKGTGLGLYGVYRLVKEYDGHIDVQSDLGRGTTFRIYLPCVGSAKAGSSPPVEVTRSFPPPHSAGDATILIVEDERSVRHLYRRMLQDAGYNVLEADDGVDALEKARQRNAPIHLMVTDVVMPHLNGFELAEEMLRTQPDLRVLFVSGYVDPNELSRRRSLDSENLLQKPFVPETLVDKVREMLSESLEHASG